MPVSEISAATDGYDTYLTSINADVPQDDDPFLLLGRHAIASIQRPLIWFDTSGIPGGATINSVTLRLTETGREGSGGRDCSVYRLLVPFVEAQANWAARSTGNNWNTPGAGGAGTDYHATPIGTFTSPTGTSFPNVFDVTLSVSNLSDLQYGVIIIQDDENTNSRLYLAAGENTTHPDSDPPGTVIYRVNCGGDEVTDTPSNWGADSSGSPSVYSNYIDTGSSVFFGGDPITLTHPSVGSTPEAVFQSERWDSNTPPEMIWNFPVDVGTYTVRLCFAEIFAGAASVGARVFDVQIEGQDVLAGYDIYQQLGAAFTAIVEQFTTTVTDGNLTIEFIHVTDNPAIKGIEILTGGLATDNPPLLIVDYTESAGGSAIANVVHHMRQQGMS